MTGAHPGGRGAGRRRGYTKIAAPRGVGWGRGHGNGRHHPWPQRSFLGTFWRRTFSIETVTKFVLMGLNDRRRPWMTRLLGNPSEAADAWRADMRHPWLICAIDERNKYRREQEAAASASSEQPPGKVVLVNIVKYNQPR